MGGKAGTLRKCSIDGPSYDVIADTNLSSILSKYENTIIPTTGEGMLQQIARALEKDGLKLGCSSQQEAALVKIADDGTAVQLSITYADGLTRGCLGYINIDTSETETNTMNVKMLPKTEWATFE